MRFITKIRDIAKPISFGIAKPFMNFRKKLKDFSRPTKDPILSGYTAKLQKRDTAYAC